MHAAALASRLREITGAEEDWMAGCSTNAGAIPAYCHELLARCLGPIGAPARELLQSVRELSLSERDWLLIELRRRSLGPRIRCQARCPHCDSSVELDFATRDLPLEPVDINADADVILPSGKHVTIRWPNAEDHERFAASGTLDPLERLALAVDRLVHGLDAPIDAVDQQDRDAIERRIASAAPEGLKLELECHECGQRLSAPFDACAFVFAEVKEHSKTLLDDVHTLARTYHWSESEILRLSLTRRLAYLTRIERERDAALFQSMEGVVG